MTNVAMKLRGKAGINKMIMLTILKNNVYAI